MSTVMAPRRCSRLRRPETSRVQTSLKFVEDSRLQEPGLADTFEEQTRKKDSDENEASAEKHALAQKLHIFYSSYCRRDDP